MSKLEALEGKAMEYASSRHKTQKRRFTHELYVEHCKRVAEIVRSYKKSHEIDKLVSSALLHDTIEDTNTTEEDLEKMFGGLVSSLVVELTSDKAKIRKEGKQEYLSDKMIHMSSWALVIKLADRLDNVNDLDKTSEEFRNRYSKETVYILNMLEAHRKLTKTQVELVGAIRLKLKELTEKK